MRIWGKEESEKLHTERWEISPKFRVMRHGRKQFQKREKPNAADLKEFLGIRPGR